MCQIGIQERLAQPYPLVCFAVLYLAVLMFVFTIAELDLNKLPPPDCSTNYYAYRGGMTTPGIALSYRPPDHLNLIPILLHYFDDIPLALCANLLVGCSEIVNWIMCKTPVDISKEQMELIRGALVSLDLAQPIGG